MTQKLHISKANLDPIENQGCNLIKNWSKLWFGRFCISLNLLVISWSSDLNDVQFLGHFILNYLAAFPYSTWILSLQFFLENSPLTQVLCSMLVCVWDCLMILPRQPAHRHLMTGIWSYARVHYEKLPDKNKA